jgi:membrane protein DedA with SNARE-associated domain
MQFDSFPKLVGETTYSFLAQFGYKGIVATFFLNTFPGFPPSEFLCIFYGSLAARGELNLAAVIGTAIVANVAGTSVFFVLARRKGARIADQLRTLPDKRPAFRPLRYIGFGRSIDIVMRLFASHGQIIVLVGRNIPLLRSVISIPAGISGMPWRRFLLFTTVGISLWITGWTLIGYFIGRIVDTTFYWLFVLGALLVAWVAGIVLGRVLGGSGRFD